MEISQVEEDRSIRHTAKGHALFQSDVLITYYSYLNYAMNSTLFLTAVKCFSPSLAMPVLSNFEMKYKIGISLYAQ